MFEIIKLSIPVAVVYLAQMAMGFVSLIAVGRIGPTDIGAVGIGSSFFGWLMIIGIGILSGLDFFVSRAYGAGRKEEAFNWLIHAILLSLVMAVPLTIALYYVADHLNEFGINPQVVPSAARYLEILALTLLPVYIFTAFRQYLQAHGNARPAMYILLFANAINAVLQYALVLGKLGFESGGAVGSAISILIARIWMVFAIIVYFAYWDRKHYCLLKGLNRLVIKWRSIVEMLKLGFPAALQMMFEVGVFAFASILAGRLAAVELAAHQVVINIVSLTFMVPLGISSAIAVLVGQAIGRRNFEAIPKLGWTGMGLGVGFMALSLVVLLISPFSVLGFYTKDAGVLEVAQTVLVIGALFQLFDGVQVVATGALRGVGDTKTAMLANFSGHWLIGLPAGLVLCFVLDFGLPGLWIGLLVGLAVVATWLILRWNRINDHLRSLDIGLLG